MPSIKTEFPVLEIFYSIEGEGVFMGSPTLFIRFAGCNLNCSFCDTPHATTTAKTMGIDELVKEIFAKLTAIAVNIHSDLKPKTIIKFTGGEPTLYKVNALAYEIREFNNLMGDLHDIFISMETNGTKAGPFPSIDWIVVSPKPDSNYVIRPDPDELKYVVDASFKIQNIPNHLINTLSIWLQPADNKPENMKIVQDLVLKNTGLRAGIQLHKTYGVR